MLPSSFVIVALALLTPGLAQTETKPLIFKDAQLRLQEGDKTRDLWSTITYDSEQVVIAPTQPDKKRPDQTRRVAYADVAAAEYTYGKSPRVTAAVLVSPLFLFNSSKSHWLTIKLKNSDYALLRLDKSNYKLVIAELEKRAHIKVESIGESK